MCYAPNVSVAFVFRFNLFTLVDDVDGLTRVVALSAVIATVKVYVHSVTADVFEVEVDDTSVAA